MNRFTIRLQIFIIIFLLILLFVGIAYSYQTQLRQTTTVEFIGKQPIEGRIFEQVAYISGAVSSPGVYSINNETRIADLVEFAGGISKEADTTFINETLNLSKIVEDETHIYIPYQNQAQGNETSSKQINLNQATSNELESLPGIGPSTANKIINGRPYGRIEDLLNISGIGDAKFNSIKDLISIE